MFRSFSGVTKPPNILIVSGRSEPLYQWKQLLWSILARDSYVIYELKKIDLGKELWKPYTSLLILDQIEELDHSQAESVENYVCEGGRALLHCSIYPRREGSRLLWSCGPLGENVPASCCYGTCQESVDLYVMLKTLEGELQSELGFEFNTSLFNQLEMPAFSWAFRCIPITRRCQCIHRCKASIYTCV